MKEAFLYIFCHRSVDDGGEKLGEILHEYGMEKEESCSHHYVFLPFFFFVFTSCFVSF